MALTIFLRRNEIIGKIQISYSLILIDIFSLLQASPINLKRSILLAERYAPNPQYSACSATGIPVLKKETLAFLKEVGEGCFGKVYKGK